MINSSDNNLKKIILKTSVQVSGLTFLWGLAMTEQDSSSRIFYRNIAYITSLGVFLSHVVSLYILENNE